MISKWSKKSTLLFIFSEKYRYNHIFFINGMKYCLFRYMYDICMIDILTRATLLIN